MPSGRLRQFIEAKQHELPQLKRRFSPSWREELLSLIPAAPSFLDAITPTSSQHVCLIGEIKPSSPSAGYLSCPQMVLDTALPHYNQFVQALSVLTEPQFFGGSPELFQQVGQRSPLPRLWKDFVIDPFQLQLARACGASAVLLIVKALKGSQLNELHQAALEQELLPVVEAQSKEEIERAVVLGAQAVLINNRDLETLDVDLATTERLAPLLPETTLCISASGLSAPTDLQRLAPYCQSFLIGTSLMKTSLDGLAVKLQELTQALSGAVYD